MIGFFPEIYEDELVYSRLCRYYQRSGYTKYIFAADDLYKKRTVHPSVEWVNEFTTDAMEHITRRISFEDLIRHHTMFPAYTRFLPKERRNKALQSLMTFDGNYYNLIVNQKLEYKRFLRYCPACAAEDRVRYGETYWHREHQIIRIDICPKHRCFLKDSTVPVTSRSTPGLFPAEIEIPLNEVAEPCMSEKQIAFAKYVIDVFRLPVDLEGDTPIGTYLQSQLDIKYLSENGIQLNSEQLYQDYAQAMNGICEPMPFEMFRKVYYNTNHNHQQIYQIAFFQKLPPEKLAVIPISTTLSAMEELYKDLAQRYHVPVDTVATMGKEILTLNRKIGKLAKKSGPKQRAWAELDEKYLPRVKAVVDEIYDPHTKPSRLSVKRVEREMGLPGKQLQLLPKCTEYIKAHMESQNEYRARQVTWAVHKLQAEGRTVTIGTIKKALNIREGAIEVSWPYISDSTIRGLIAEFLKE